MSLLLSLLPEAPEFVSDPAYQPFTTEELAQIDDILAMTTEDVVARSGRGYVPTSREFYAIDSEYSADRDDAIALEYGPNGEVTLHVAIADVAAYIEKGSPLDLRGIAQAVTRYGEPEKKGNGRTDQLRVNIYGDLLSEQHLSLASHQNPALKDEQFHYLAADKTHENLLLVASITLDAEDRVVRTEISRQRGKIHRLSKLETAAWIDKNREGFERMSDEIGMRMGNRRLATPHYSIDTGMFDIERQRVPSAEDGQMTEVEAGIATVQLMIQEAMILTNQETARIMQASGMPYLFRNHAVTVYYVEGERTRTKRLYNPEELQAFLQAMPSQGQTLRFIEPDRAEVAPVMDGHMGLGMTSYAWWTSPIRRYTDLVNQRAAHYLLDVVARLGELAPEINLRGLWDIEPNGYQPATDLLFGLVRLHEHGSESSLMGLFDALGAENPGGLVAVMREEFPLPYTREEVAYIAEVFNHRLNKEKAKESARPGKRRDSAAPTDWRDPAADLELLLRVFPEPDFDRLVNKREYTNRGFCKILQAALQEPTAVFRDTPMTDEALATVKAACRHRMQDKGLSPMAYAMVFSVADPAGRWEDLRQEMWGHVRQDPKLAGEVVKALCQPDRFALSRSFHMSYALVQEWLEVETRRADVAMRPNGQELSRHASIVVATDARGRMWTAEGSPMALSGTFMARTQGDELAAVAFLDAFLGGHLQPLNRQELPPELWSVKKGHVIPSGKAGRAAFDTYLMALAEDITAGADMYLNGDGALVKTAVAETMKSGMTPRKCHQELQAIVRRLVPAAVPLRDQDEMLTREEMLEAVADALGYPEMSLRARSRKPGEKGGKKGNTGKPVWEAVITFSGGERRDPVYEVRVSAATKRGALDKAVDAAFRKLEELHPIFFAEYRAPVAALEENQLPRLARQTADAQGVRFEPA